MARVIKAGQGNKPAARPATRVVVDAGVKKVIERELFQAKQDAEHILKRAEQERSVLIADGKKQAARAHEEAMSRGASEAFASAASEALAAFRKRAERYGEAADDIRALALEVVRKILGTEPDLGPKDIDKILSRGMAVLRARRRLRLQVSAQRLGELANERPNLMRALQNEPDLVIEAVDDVGEGFARVVTEVGGALCAEETALDALSVAVNVREQPRASRAATGNTHVGTGPTGIDALRVSTGDSVPDAAVEEDPSELDDIEEVSAEPDPDADEDADDTINFSARPSTARINQKTDDVEEIEAEEDPNDLEPTARLATRVPTGQVKAPSRAATRVVAIDSTRGALVSHGNARAVSRANEEATGRHAGIASQVASSEEKADEDLDLFTDDAVKPPRKRP